MLATDAGRERFWAESSLEQGGQIEWRFPNGVTETSKVLQNVPGTCFAVEYFGGSVATFELVPDESGGTDLTLTDVGVPEDQRIGVSAGWVSVLLALKTALDFSIDVRSHDPERTWDQGFVDN